MKRFFILWVFLFSLPCFAQPSSHLSPRQKTALKESRLKIDAIELIEGTPKDRKFQKIVPVWATALKMPDAIKKAKKDAYKVGADAIIEFQFGTRDASSFGAGGNIAFGSHSLAPVVQGWAVKWIN